MGTIKWLSILLSLSLGANLWFIWHFNNYQTIDKQQNQSKQDKPSETIDIAALPSRTWQTNNITNSTIESVTNDKTQTSTNNNRIVDLKELADKQQYETLEYEVREYLRQFPQDLDALLLEAQAYFHTKPLNVAIIHYQELLSQPLSPEQRQQILKLIEVNTTRVIQQFSGDGTWDLLAKFLEPLVQVDPLNKTYLLALARAYGMQEQLSLMENVLASMSPQNPRALRLRDNVMARLNDTNDDSGKDVPALDTNINNDFGQQTDRPADLMLKKRGRHFIAQASINDSFVNLLLDTGASTTAISDEKFSQLKGSEVEFLGLFTVNTAGGEIQAPIYKVKQFVLGSKKLNNTSVLVLPADNLRQFDGLLGMNVLSQFDMTFDAASGTMRMYKK